MKNLTILVFSILLLSLISCNNKVDKQKETEQTKTESNMGKTIPEWTKDKVIYEINVRQYSKGGNFEAVKNDLPRLKELGVEILWFMPIYPIGEINRKGSLGSYYSIQNYTAINPEFGTLEDFKEIVNEAHKLGMYVIIDWVANHTAWDHVWTKSNPDFFTRDSIGNIVSPVDDWSDVADLNYENLNMRQAMINDMKFWLTEADVDGFRCDVAMMVPTEFWNEARRQLDEIKPVFMLAEAEQQDLHEAAFDACYSWELMHTLNAVAKGEKPCTEIDSILAWENKTFSPDVYHLRFTTNHDENSWNGTVFERLGDGAKAFSVLCYTIPGIPLIYSGQEAAMKTRLAFFDKDEIPWGEYEYQEFYTKLNQLKKGNPALWSGLHGGEFFRLQSNTDSENIYAFARTKEANKIIVVLNLSNTVAKAEISLPEVLKGRYTNYFIDEPLELTDSLNIELGAWDYKVMVK
jgi:glycosidase